MVEVSKSWDEANKAYKEGSLADALAKGKSAKEKAAQIMSSLGMSAPPAAGTLSGRAYTSETPAAGGR